MKRKGTQPAASKSSDKCTPAPFFSKYIANALAIKTGIKAGPGASTSGNAMAH
jgi:hypothetical protein